MPTVNDAVIAAGGNVPGGLEGLAGRIVLLWGWRRALLAAGLGALSALALAPFHLLPVLFVTFTGLVWLMDGIGSTGWRGVRSAAGIGWCFGFGYFLVGLHWVGAAFLVERDVFGWLMPFAVLGLAAGMAIYFALGLALARLSWSHGALRIAALGFGLGASEWLRGHLFTGFPWGLLGYGLTAGDALSQGAAVFGIYGLTLLVVLICASPATLADLGTRSKFLLPGLAALGLAGLAAFGAVRLGQARDGAVPDVRVRVVQPNIDQSAKWRRDNRDEILGTLLALSRRAPSPGSGGTTLLVWPETAFPFFLSDAPEALLRVAALLPSGTNLLTGAARYEEPGPGEENVHVFNSIYAIGAEGAILARYDKVHLVPFGEYLPFQGVLEAIGLRQLTRIRGGFSAGPRHATVTLRGAPPFAPLICYEAIFPGEVVDPGNRPGWLLNVTNDAWFGTTIGPYQHLDQARIRAVEQGVPMIRAANSGISAVIDGYGRIRRALALGTAGVIDEELPSALAPTPYARYGDGLFAGLLAAAALAAAAGRAGVRRV